MKTSVGPSIFDGQPSFILDYRNEVNKEQSTRTDTSLPKAGKGRSQNLPTTPTTPSSSFSSTCMQTPTHTPQHTYLKVAKANLKKTPPPPHACTRTHSRTTWAA